MRPSLSLRLTAAAGTAAAVLAASPPAHAADAVYGGTTRDGAAIVLKADQKAQRLSSLVVSWIATCGQGSHFGNSATLKPAKPTPGFEPGPGDLLVERNAKGRFSGSQLAAEDLGDNVAGTVVKVEGKLSRTKASGTLSATVTIFDKASHNQVDTCKATTKFAAAHAPRTIYGGATSQDEPVVLRVTRRKVDDLIVTWEASCQPQGFMRVPDHFGNFSVKSSGAFGSPFSDDVGMDDGGKAHVDYTVLGKVAKTAVKGTLRVKFNESDAAGTATTFCDSGGITYQATTG
jgi:hypothetical protein